jgi:hypothetical protein
MMFGRIEMYDNLPAGRMATAVVYYDSIWGRNYLSCGDRYVKPGGRVCYTSENSDEGLKMWDWQAVGREYYSAGGQWHLMAEGYTSKVAG